MKQILILAALGLAIGMTCAAKPSEAQEKPPLRVAIAGLVHGHVDGFFRGALKRQDIQMVGIAEPDRALFEMYAKKYGLEERLYHADLEEMLRTTKPQAVLGYTSTYDHLKSGANLREVGCPCDDGKAAGRQRQRCLRDRQSRQRRKNHGPGELRNVVGIPAIMMPMTWYIRAPSATSEK